MQPEGALSMQEDARVALATLIRQHRQAALGTLDEQGAPFVSMVLYVPEEHIAGRALHGFLIHVSRLSPHTRHMEANERVSLLIAQPDTGAGDAQQLPRVTIQACARRIPHESEEYTRSKARYISRLPASEFLFTLPDFALYRLIPTEARYIGGFARAFSLSGEQLQAVFA